MSDVLTGVIMPPWLWPLLIGPFIGSFMGVLIVRLPAGRPVALARSACAHCGTRLRVPDLVPLLSYLALRGRCRYCGKPISPLHPAVELAAVAVVVSALIPATDPRLLWISCGLGWTLLTLAWIDVADLLLPDLLTLPLIAAGLLITWILQPEEWPDHAAAAALGYLAFEALALVYRRLRGQEGLGGGDAKLIAAAGAWCGLLDLPVIVLASALFGLLTALAAAVRAGRLDARAPIPFGPSIAAAFWLVWLLPDLADQVLARLGG